MAKVSNEHGVENRLADHGVAEDYDAAVADGALDDSQRPTRPTGRIDVAGAVSV